MRRVFPIAEWLPKYQRGWLRSDLLGGLTVTAILIPDAQLAGVGPEAAFVHQESGSRTDNKITGRETPR